MVRQIRDVERHRREDSARKNRGHAEKAVIVLQPCADKERRELLESDDIEWLLYYFGVGCGLDDPFWYKFTAQQQRMIAAIRSAIRDGGDQAFAASRGEGKTTIAERLLLKCTLTGELNYSVLFASTGGHAETSLDSIKTAITDNELLLADYPEVCTPVIELAGAPQRANTQRVNGFRHDTGEPYEMAETRFSWCGQEVIFPNVPGSPSARAIIATRGLDAAVRGLKKRGKRPKLAVIDDPDTEDTARSEEQSKKLEMRIDRAIGGMGGQQRGIGRVILTTLQSRIAVSYKYTDREQKPSFKGERFRFLVEKPTRWDLWEQYVSMRREDWRNETALAHEFYIENREAMDAGAAVANPNRYEQGQLSALQFYFDEAARKGLDYAQTELDNDPPEESGPVESGINVGLIQRQLNGLPVRALPPGTVAITHTVDVGKWKLHWVVRAWLADGSGHTIEYGIQDVHGAKLRSDEGLDRALRAAVRRRIDEFHESNYSQGEVIETITLVDAGYRTDAIYAACAEAGIGVYPVMGFGKSAGCCGANFSPVQNKTRDVKPGDGWKMVRRGRIWLVECDADRWKAYEHDRWMTATDKPGCMFLWGTPSNQGERERMSADELGHRAYAQQICAEVEVEEMVKGVLKRKWKAKGENHWLDASYYGCVAANIKGVRLPMVSVGKATDIPESSYDCVRRRVSIPDHMRRR